MLVCAALAGCRVSEAKIHNLEQLHDAESRHRYSAALEGDLEFVLRHKVLGALAFGKAQPGLKSPAEIEAPADACLENLIELAEIDTTDPVVIGHQVEWFARLAVEDPWSLSRARAITALAREGRRLKVGLPRGLGSDQTPAGPDDVAARAEEVVKAMRGVLERQATRADLERACDGLRALDLDVAGGRRALRIATELAGSAGQRDPDLAPVRALAVDLQKLCIARALSLALDDREPRVRAAALQSIAEIGGAGAVDLVLFDRLGRDLEPEVQIAIADILAQNGPQALGAPGAAKSREDWLAALWSIVAKRRESDVRTHAMLALGQIAVDGPNTLREEDWQAWWFARGGSAASGDGAAR